jgi:outer membrane protein OmpA-like peptidoglycan-associated protein
MTPRHSHIVIFAALVFLMSGCGTKTSEPTAMPAAPARAAAPAAPPHRSATRSAAPTPKPVATGIPMAQSATTAPPQVTVAVEDFTDEPALKDIFFDAGRTDVGRSAVQLIRDNARWMVENPGNLILIEGHSDHKGTRESNRAAGERRAAAAAIALVREGVPGTQMWTVSHGSERPLCAEKTDACAAKNRRVHFKIKKLQ